MRHAIFSEDRYVCRQGVVLSDKAAEKVWSERRQIRQSRKEAYLTIFLSLTLTVMLSLLFTLIYGTRVNAARMQTEIILDTAANSCLGEYSRELLSQYDLFFIDTSYGTAQHSEELTRRHFKKYAEENADNGGTAQGMIHSLNSLTIDTVSLTNARFACDRNFTPVLEQIQAYMLADPAGEAASELLAMVDNFEGIGLDLNEWNRQKGEVSQELEDAQVEWEESQNQDEEQGGSREESSGEEGSEGAEEPDFKDPGATVDSFRSTPLVTQVFGTGTDTVSNNTIQVNELYSHRTPHYGSGLEAANSHHYQKASMAVLNLYLFEKCGNLRNSKEDSALAYELEYLLCGKESDRENMEGVLARLCAIRMAANCMYLFSSSTRRQEAEAVASLLGTAIAVPALVPVLTTAILLAWGYVESISDLKTLTSGGKVPILKDDSTWQTGINLIDNPTAVTGQVPLDGSQEDSSSGLDYETYLGILLFLQNKNDKLARLMDVCEMDIRRTQGNQNFCMDWCMDTFEASIVTNSSVGYSCGAARTITYN